jgi:DNA-binding NarL/FixJ family response regulator
MRKRKVVIVDDESHYREGLRDFLLREADVDTYESPDDFAEKFTRPSDLEEIYLIILDYRFDNYNAYDKDLVTYLREDLQYKGRVVLWSLEDEVPREFSRHLNAVLPKKILSLAEIDQCLESR